MTQKDLKVADAVFIAHFFDKKTDLKLFSHDRLNDDKPLNAHDLFKVFYALAADILLLTSKDIGPLEEWKKDIVEDAFNKIYAKYNS